MAFVVSHGEVRGLARPTTSVPRSLQITPGYTSDYAAIWRTHGSVRTVTDFLARNIASLGLHLFERAGDADRRRVTDHPLAQLIGRRGADLPAEARSDLGREQLDRAQRPFVGCVDRVHLEADVGGFGESGIGRERRRDLVGRRLAATQRDERADRPGAVLEGLGEAVDVGQRAAAAELALEGLYLIRKIDKQSGDRETIYG